MCACLVQPRCHVTRDRTEEIHVVPLERAGRAGGIRDEHTLALVRDLHAGGGPQAFENVAGLRGIAVFGQVVHDAGPAGRHHAPQQLPTRRKVQQRILFPSDDAFLHQRTGGRLGDQCHGRRVQHVAGDFERGGDRAGTIRARPDLAQRLAEPTEAVGLPRQASRAGCLRRAPFTEPHARLDRPLEQVAVRQHDRRAGRIVGAVTRPPLRYAILVRGEGPIDRLRQSLGIVRPRGPVVGPGEGRAHHRVTGRLERLQPPARRPARRVC